MLFGISVLDIALGVMRKVVDSNFLQNPELREYLTKSRTNIAVLTDYAAMEAHKGDTLASIYKSMSILVEFPAQVIVLKGTRAVCGLSGRGSGLQKRLIDSAQTRNFPIYCQRLQAAKAENGAFQSQLLENGREATAHLDKMLADAASMPDTINEIAKTYSREELRLLRSSGHASEELIRKLIESVLAVAETMFTSHPNVERLPLVKELPNTFIFRAALCAYLLALDWIAEGGAKGAKASTIRNDMVDINFATFATFFDGLLSGDGKAQHIYREACVFLNGVFGCNVAIGYP